MHPAARLSAIIELFDLVLADWSQGKQTPADLAFQRYTKARRFIGGGDRRALAEGYYGLWRDFGLARWVVITAGQAVSGRNLLLAYLARTERLAAESGAFGQVPHAPGALTDEERNWLAHIDWTAAPASAKANLPDWLYDLLHRRFGARTEAELAAFAEPAPLTLRANTLKTTQAALLAELRSLGHRVEPTRFSPHGVTLMGRVAAGQLAALNEGRAEIQDESSQLAALASGVAPGCSVIDLCAGAGGKTLALAALMRNEGRILAVDLNPHRLAQLGPRAARAGVTIAEPFLLSGPEAALPPGWAQADAVFVDAPCTGFGTWRRNPDLPWRTTPTMLDALRTAQAMLLERAVNLLKPGGRLIYATCSVLHEENSDMVKQALDGKLTLSVVPPGKLWNKTSPLREDPLGASDPHDETGPYVTLTPERHGTDGFTFAALHQSQG